MFHLIKSNIMASVDTSNRNDGKKGKPQRKILRVDFTPMVDMNMLLITFFMFTTTLSIPQVMQLAMPANEKADVKSPASKSITVILGQENKVFYYFGEPDYEDYTSLKETDYRGLRNMLAERNSVNMNKISDLRLKRAKNEISETSLKEQTEEINRSKDALMVLIKPTKEANFKNMVDVLDEMQITGIGKYMVVDLEKSDHFLMDNLSSKGSLTAMIDRPN